jgi:hypothetical protein
MNPHAEALLDGANKARLAGDDIAADILMLLIDREMERVRDPQ